MQRTLRLKPTKGNLFLLSWSTATLRTFPWGASFSSKVATMVRSNCAEVFCELTTDVGEQSYALRRASLFGAKGAQGLSLLAVPRLDALFACNRVGSLETGLSRRLTSLSTEQPVRHATLAGT
jgi:hypothetical protein